MKHRKLDNDAPVGKLIEVSDTLPPPEVLAKSLESAKVTIYLSKRSVDFFKKQAEKYHTKYQRLIRILLDNYVAQRKA